MIWLLLIVIVVAIMLEYRSLHIPVRFVHYHITPSKKSVEQGEEFKINTTIENATNYNIPYLLLEETIQNVMKIKYHCIDEKTKTQRGYNLAKVNQPANVLEPGFEPRGI